MRSRRRGTCIEYGTTREQLAEVAVAARGWANGNPEAFARGPLTIDECLAARMVSDPISVRDCCLVTDGAAAIVMTRADRARDCPRPPVPLLGAAAATWCNAISQAMPDLTTTAAAEIGPRAYAHGRGRARRHRRRPALRRLHDQHDPVPRGSRLLPQGRGRALRRGSGAIAPGGALPVNTNGGGLSCCHPGMYGLFAIVEAARQLRGEAANQIAGVDVALAHGNGGMLSSQATVILGSMATL